MQSGTGQLKRLVIALALALWGTVLPAQAEPSLVQTSNVIWTLDEPWFGGFSGLEMGADGETLHLITDRGTLAKARLSRTDGTIQSIQLLSQILMTSANGEPLKGPFRDAEGLVLAGSEAAYVSFEFRHRVTKLDLNTGKTNLLPTHKDFADFGRNAGLEPLAIHPDGRLFTLSEGGPDGTGAMPLYAFDQGAWRIVDHLDASGGFRPVGADIDDQGRLYLLERSISPLGFRSRIRRFDLTQTPAPSATLLSSLPATYDNLEAISVWRDAGGETRLTLISDDNFISFQTTQIVEFLLIE